MLKADFLHLVDDTSITYKVHPVVIFSVLDHYKRRGDGQERVIGTLLGIKSGNTVEITNCFPVPHIENPETAALDMDYHESMLALHKRVNPQEIVVGWYSTGKTISYVSSLMHEVYQNQITNPVHLTVDVHLTNSQMAVRAYTGKIFSMGDANILSRFEPAKLLLHAYDTEKIGVEALITGPPDDDNVMDSPAKIYTEFDNLENSMARLLELFETVGAYVTKVESGEITGDLELGRDLLVAMAYIPKMNRAEFNNMFNKNIQDLLMVVYLANLTRLQLGIADKINGLL